MKPQKKIGDILVEEGYTNSESVKEALGHQQQCGSKLGKLLMLNGSIQSDELSKALAKQHATAYVDLNQQPANLALLDYSHREQYMQFHAIPWQQRDGVMIITASDRNPLLEEWVAKLYSNQPYQIKIACPKQIEQTIKKAFQQYDDFYTREWLYHQKPNASSKYILRSKRTLYCMVSATILLLLLWSGFGATSLLTGFLVAINIYYAVTLAFKLVLFYLRKKVSFYSSSLMKISDKDLPIYSLLIPLYKESAILPQLLFAIDQLDYPKAKMDVKLVLEEDDEETINRLAAVEYPSYIDVVIVPHSYPKTKPKACNYAMQYVKGEYVTIYDAEDMPEKDQLRKAVAAFKEAGDEVICFQARLNYYNRHTNLLTKLFSIEYSIWFNFLLKGLHFLKMPIPLGGTSNHISVKHLKEIGFWDPYNVTEDADLGLRIARSGYKVALLDSTTWEESPVKLGAWVRQRSRWLKGYMQTYIIQMRQPLSLLQTLKARGFISVQLFIGAPPLVYLLSPFIWMISLFSLIPSLSGFLDLDDWLVQLMWGNLIINIVLHMVFALQSVRYEKWKKMMFPVVLFPLYNFLHMLSSFKALWQLLLRPHYWEKTIHGHHIALSHVYEARSLAPRSK